MDGGGAVSLPRVGAERSESGWGLLMAQTDIEASMLMTWTYEADQFPEVSSWGIHSILRDDTEYENVFDWMENFVADVATTIMTACTLRRVSISNWAAGPGFTGYHLLASRDLALAFGSGNPAPHQCALAVGYRNTTESGVALGRRRNRFYLGPIKTTVIGTDSRLTSALQGSWGATLNGQSGELQSITTPTGGEAYAGFSPVSVAEQAMFSG
jgi:hypothetical protein